MDEHDTDQSFEVINSPDNSDSDETSLDGVLTKVNFNTF